MKIIALLDCPLVSPVNSRAIWTVVDEYSHTVITVKHSQSEDMPTLGLASLSLDRFPCACDHPRRFVVAVAILELDVGRSSGGPKVRKRLARIRHGQVNSTKTA